MRRRNPFSHTVQPPLWVTPTTRKTKPLRGVPSPDAQLLVMGRDGIWAYVGRMDCGRAREGVLLVEWSERTDALASRHWVDIDQVRVVEG